MMHTKEDRTVSPPDKAHLEENLEPGLFVGLDIGGTKTAVQAGASQEETGYEDYVTVYDPQAGKKCKSPVSRGVREALAVGILGVYNPALAVESAAKWWVLD